MFPDAVREFKYTLNLSVPITVGLFGQGLFGVIDTVMIGNILGEHALAAATLANSITWMPLLLSFGLCSAVPVLTAQARGAGNAGSVPAILRHGLLVSLIFSLLGSGAVAAFVYADGLLALGQPALVAADARVFSFIIAASIPFATGFQAIKFFRDASGGQWISLFWMLAGLLANIFLNWVLMTGALGFPRWGLEGAAAGTLFSRLFSLVGIAVHKRLVCEFRHGFSLREIKENLRISVPATLHIFFEAGIFILMPFVMGLIGAASIAANQVAMSISSLAYMVPLGIAQALSIRVGEAFGQKNCEKIRSICAGALLFPLALMVALAVGLLVFRKEIPLLFNLGEEASALAATFLLIEGAYLVFDSFQTIAAGALRGLSDVRVIPVAAFLGYWILALPLALVLAFPCALGGVGVWIGLAAGLACLAHVLGSRPLSDLRRERLARLF